MRIKTSKSTLEQLTEVTKHLKFSSNAETLKLAISFALNKYSVDQITDLDYDQNGFEIDTHILFADDENYYMEIIKFYFKTDKVENKHLCLLIEAGFNEVVGVLKRNKHDLARIVNYILEV